MKIFNQRVNELWTERFKKHAEQYQRLLAAFLQKQSQRFSNETQKRVLIVFCVGIIIYCVLLILQP